jgi:hypothetical protein
VTRHIKLNCVASVSEGGTPGLCDGAEGVVRVVTVAIRTPDYN